jgi:hypothetical protein
VSETVLKPSALRGFTSRLMGLLELPGGNSHSRGMEHMPRGRCADGE